MVETDVVSISWHIKVHVNDTWVNGTGVQYCRQYHVLSYVPDGGGQVCKVDILKHLVDFVQCLPGANEEMNQILFSMVQELCMKHIEHLGPYARGFRVWQQIQHDTKHVSALDKHGVLRIGLHTMPRSVSFVMEGSKEDDSLNKIIVEKRGAVDQLIQLHVQHVALMKLCKRKHGVAYASGEAGLAEAYVRANLWDAAYRHVVKALDALRDEVDNINGVHAIRCKCWLIKAKFYAQGEHIQQAQQYVVQAIDMAEKLDSIEMGEYYIAQAEICILAFKTHQRVRRESAKQEAEDWICSQQGVQKVKAELRARKLTDKAKMQKRLHKAQMTKILKYGDRGISYVEDAAKLYHKVYDTRIASLGKNHIDVACTLAALGSVYILWNKLEQAATYLDEAIQVYEVSFNASSLSMISKSVAAAFLRVHLGRLYHHLGNATLAMNNYAIAASSYASMASTSTDVSYIRDFSTRAQHAYEMLLSLQGEPKDRKQTAKQMLIVSRVGYGDGSPEYAKSLQQYSKAAAATKDLDAAQSALIKSNAIQSIHYGNNDLRVKRLARRMAQLSNQTA